MRITLAVGEQEHECAVPYPGAQHVVVEGASCPRCITWPALVQDGRVVALASSTPGLHRACMAFPGAQVVGPGPGSPLHARMPHYVQDSGGWHGEATCARCEAVVGTMRVHSSTIFGAEEEARVLRGPWRVF